MRKILFIALAGFLAGCATVPGPVQKVEVPVAVSCVKTVPAKPALPAVPKTGIFDQAKALIVRDKIRKNYEAELEAVIAACR